MLRLMIVGTALLGAAPEPQPEADPAGARAAYRAAASAAGHDSDAQVRLALWCEARGMTAERIKHLALAVLADPGNASARGLMGLVADAGRWRKPDAVAARVKADADLSAALAEYNARRDQATDSAESQWRLALWCEEAGLKAEATAHLAAVVRLDPKRESAWRRLGYKKQKDGHWATDEQVAAAKADAEAQRKADRRWRPLLEKWKGQLATREKRAEAEDQLAGVTDPRAVPSIWRVFAAGKEADQLRAVQLLGQVDAPKATQGLAVLAVAAPSAEVRKAATETLRRRDPREFLGMLIGLLRKPMKYEVKPVNGPGSTGVLFVEGERYNVRREYALPGASALPRLFADGVPFDPTGGFPAWRSPFGIVNGADLWAASARNGTRPAEGLDLDMAQAQAAARDAQIGQQMAAIRASTAVAQQQMIDDVAAIRSTNAAVGAENGRVVSVLNAVTGEALGPDREAWTAWWTDQQGYAYTPPQSAPRPTFTQEVALPVAYNAIPPRHSCFAAGTTVRTLAGPRPIESIRPGDRVLTQDPKTGSLAFKPVLVAYHNPPAPTLKLDLGGEAVVATGIHRFWRVGKGWAMARELKPGDLVRTLGGAARVGSVESEKVRPVFNLEVADVHDFFVGPAGALAHDNSLVQPEPAPFDAPAAVADAERSALSVAGYTPPGNILRSVPRGRPDFSRAYPLPPLELARLQSGLPGARGVDVSREAYYWWPRTGWGV